MDSRSHSIIPILLITLLVSLGFLYVTSHLQAALILKIDTSAYLVGETPVYTISGASPNSQIRWSSTLNNQSTGESNAYYGQITDSNGFWQGQGGIWQTSHLGQWTKTATVGGQQITASFGVYQGSISVSPSSCNAPCNVSLTWTSNSPNVTRIYRTPSFPSSNYWNANPSGSSTDWSLSAGSYQYCLRIVDSKWVETKNASCKTVTVSQATSTPSPSVPKLTTDKSSYLVGQQTLYTLANAPANSQIR